MFQLRSEQRKKTQFDDTLDALKTYASQKYVKDINHLTGLFTDLSEPEVKKPKSKSSKKITVTLPDKSTKEIDDMDEFEKEEFRLSAKNYVKEKTSLEATKRSLFIVIMGQCSRLMKSKLKGGSEFEETEKECKVGNLLKLIRKISREANTNESLYDALDEAKARYYKYRQAPEDENEQHLRTFKNIVEVAEDHGANLFKDQKLFEHEKKLDSDANKPAKSDDEYWELVKNKAMGTSYVKWSDLTRYKHLLMDIRDQHGYGINVYPKSLAADHNMIEDYARSRGLYPKKKIIDIETETKINDK